MLTPGQQKAAINAAGNGADLTRIAEQAGVKLAELRRIRYADPHFDHALVEASRGRLTPCVRDCPGADCGKATSYDKKVCRKDACRDAHRAALEAMPSRQGRRRPADLLTPGEVAKLGGVTVAEVNAWEAAGHLTPEKTDGGHRRFLRPDVEEFLTTLHHGGGLSLIAHARRIISSMILDLQARLAELDQAEAAALRTQPEQAR